MHRPDAEAGVILLFFLKTNDHVVSDSALFFSKPTTARAAGRPWAAQSRRVDLQLGFSSVAHVATNHFIRT